MSNEVIALLLQFLMLVVFATAIRSVNKGKPGQAVPFVCGLFCVIFTGVFAVLDIKTLAELAPFVRDGAVDMVDAINQVFANLFAKVS